jgi:hypothetical protein
MQVLVIVVQNTTDYRDLGVATSAVTFFRTLGSSFGAAVFGSIYANRLTANLGAALAADPGVDPRAAQTPQALHNLPPAAAPLIHAYAETIQSLFLSAIPVAGVAFLLAVLLKEVPLRDFVRAGSSDLGEGFAMPDAQSSDGELERCIARIVARDGGAAAPGVLAASDSGLAPATAWCLAQVHLRERYAGPVDVSAVAHAYRIPAPVLQPAFDQAIADGVLAVTGVHLALTPRGEVAFAKLSEAWRRWLVSKLPERDGQVVSDDQLDVALHRLSGKLADGITDDDRRPALAASV